MIFKGFVCKRAFSREETPNDDDDEGVLDIVPC